MSSLSTPTPVGTCGTPSTSVDDTPAEDTPSDAPGVVAAVIAPAKDQRGGHRGGKRTQACGATGKQKPAHNSICLNHCKYGDDVGVCCPDNCKFRETNWLVGNTVPSGRPGCLLVLTDSPSQSQQWFLMDTISAYSIIPHQLEGRGRGQCQTKPSKVVLS